jgi:hypothetical protein
MVLQALRSCTVPRKARNGLLSLEHSREVQALIDELMSNKSAARCDGTASVISTQEMNFLSIVPTRR